MRNARTNAIWRARSTTSFGLLEWDLLAIGWWTVSQSLAYLSGGRDRMIHVA